jgi:hypothetical protein
MILMLVIMKFVVRFTFVVIPAAVAVPIRFVQVTMLFVLRSPFERAVTPIVTFDPGRRPISAGDEALFSMVAP